MVQRGSLKVMWCLATIASCASGQWLNYPAPGIPRLPDGKPNLAAPAPKAADGKPDFSGIWEPIASLNLEQVSGVAYSNQFAKLGSGLPGGIPYTGWAADLVKARNANLHRDDPGAHCLPTGPT